MQGNGPQNETEKKFFDQTKKNYITVYSADKNTPQNMIIEKADQAARNALLKFRAGTWAKGGQQNAQPQQAAQPAQQQPQQQQQQQATQPAQQPQQQQQQNPQAGTRQNPNVERLSGSVSYMNLPPDEKKVYDEAEQKAVQYYIKQGNNQQTALNKASMNANVAVLRYRQKKGRQTKG
jgi:hypothetical protein